LPDPDFVVADVGTTIYDLSTSPDWSRSRKWDAQIGVAWADVGHDALAAHLRDVEELRLQEASRQNRFKLSYYVAVSVDPHELKQRIAERLDDLGIGHTLVYSVDDLRDIGLLDILPPAATKLHAIEFIMQDLGFDETETVFCGDSGNDLSVLASHVPGVLVANATAEVRRQAAELARTHDNQAALYIARGSFLGLNGNYAGGILEGVVHFCPFAADWMAATHSTVNEN
jgi:hydroxymethylpyrimidine pyrophosphatase-like HAD family hydrolase